MAFVLLALSLLAVALTAEAQQSSENPRRIGFLGLNDPGVARHHLHAFREGLRELGWTEGQNILVEYRWGEGRPERLPVLATELVRLNVNVIVTSGAPTALAARKATRTIPIVMAQVNDPVALGLVASLARPGGNVTGLANLHSDIGPKHLEMLREMVPGISRVAVLSHPDNPGAELIRRHMQHAARERGLTIQFLSVRDASEVDGAFTAMVKQRVDGMNVAPDPLLLPHGARIVALAARHRLPASYGWTELVEGGALMAYGPSVREMFRRAASYVDRLLKGAKPADLPVEQPVKFELAINLKTARALGLTVPPAVLARADRVIK